jgi:hypothetical protein
MQHLFRLSNHIRHNGSKQQKLDEIDSDVLKLLKAARERSLCMHDADLKQVAMTNAQ